MTQVTTRIHPPHTPWSQRDRPPATYCAPKIPKFVRVHSPCAEYIPYVRFWLHRGGRLTFHQLWANILKGMKIFKPGLIDCGQGDIQPLTDPASLIYTSRFSYAEK